MGAPPEDGWQELVSVVNEKIAKTDALESAIAKAEKEHTALRSEFQKALMELHVKLAKLEVKSGVWGAIGAAIPILLYLILEKK